MFCSFNCSISMKFGQNIPGLPKGFDSVEYRGKILVGNCQNKDNSDDGGKTISDHTGMLTRRLAEPYHSPGTMVRERGVPANFC